MRRITACIRRHRLDDDLRAEIADHLARRERDLVDQGMDPREAASEARRLFGNAAIVREDARELWTFRWLESLLQDVRFATRLLARTPLFTAVAVLSLGTGICSSVAVFTVADAVLFRSLEVKAPEQLRAFRGTVRLGGASKGLSGVDAPTLASLQKAVDFADLVGFRTASGVSLVSAGASPHPVRMEVVTGNYFAAVGPRVFSGRAIGEADDRGSPAAVVISERLWRRQFGRDPSVLGRLITLNGEQAVVVGIVERFGGLVADRRADVFAPLSAGARIDPTTASNPAVLVARLSPRTSVEAAEARLAALLMGAGSSLFRAGELQVELLDASRGISDVRSSAERPLHLGLALVGVLLLIACANTAGLLLARFVSRQTEFGVRAAIGAGRARLARQLVIEAMVLAVVAAAVGLAAGWAAAPLLIRAMPEGSSVSGFELRFDWRLVAFTATVAIACAGGAAGASLLRLRHGHPVLAGGGTRSVTGGQQRLSHALIAAQVACSLLLVVGAVAMWRTLDNLRSVPPGFDLERTFVVTVNATGLLRGGDAAAYHAQLRHRISGAHGVAGATMAQLGLLTEAATTGTVTVAGFTSSSDEDRWTRMFFVGPDYFETVGMPIVRGRGITAQDDKARVAVVNEQFARFYFGGTDSAVGRIVNTDVHIIGVVADARYSTLRGPAPRAMFVPYAPVQRSQMAHIVRAEGDPAAAMRAVREAVAAHDARLRPGFSTARHLLSASMARERFFAAIAGVLSAFALLLACAGLYAAVAYGVSQRTSELAVRIALGAAPRDILGLMLKGPLQTTLAGIALGAPGSYLMLRSASSLLFGVRPFEPAALLACGGALLAAALAAAFWPARRATLIDPAAAFRNL